MRKSLVVVVAIIVSVCFLNAQAPPQTAAAAITAIRAGRLLDPEAGRILTNQVIVVEGNRIRDVGPGVAIPPNARVIDLSGMTVMPGLVEAQLWPRSRSQVVAGVPGTVVVAIAADARQPGVP